MPTEEARVERLQDTAAARVAENRARRVAEQKKFAALPKWARDRIEYLVSENEHLVLGTDSKGLSQTAFLRTCAQDSPGVALAPLHDDHIVFKLERAEVHCHVEDVAGESALAVNVMGWYSDRMDIEPRAANRVLIHARRYGVW